MDIRFVTQNDIDKVKWNSCVHYATNGNIFGYKWFLDFVAKDWDALVEGDYESVFPLTWQKNFWGNKRLVQPNLMRELGIFSIHVLSEKRVKAFLNAVPKEYKNINISLNEQNVLKTFPKGQLVPRINYQLWLNQPYEKIAGDYYPKQIEVYEKGKAAGFTLTTSLKPEKVATFFQQYGEGPEKLKSISYHQLLRIMYNALHRGWGSASGVYGPQNNLLAVNFFLYSHGKAVSLVPVESPEGEQLGALNFLFDLFIRSSANRPMILDFNSSSAKWESFGAKRNHFHQYTR